MPLWKMRMPLSLGRNSWCYFFGDIWIGLTTGRKRREEEDCERRENECDAQTVNPHTGASYRWSFRRIVANVRNCGSNVVRTSWSEFSIGSLLPIGTETSLLTLAAVSPSAINSSFFWSVSPGT